MNMFKKLLLLFVVVLSVSMLNAQVLQDSLLTELSTRYPQEKIYMQLDKQYYTSGETLWFKAYLFNGNQPSKISTNLYAQLINEKGEVFALISQHWLRIPNAIYDRYGAMRKKLADFKSADVFAGPMLLMSFAQPRECRCLLAVCRIDTR
jgi:hypothetical protein